MRKRCILKKDCHCGMRLFWMEPCHTDDAEFNQEYATIYAIEKSETLIAILHITQILMVPESTGTIKKWGDWFPEDTWLNSVKEEWDNERKG
ncbi:hypothetical protein [Candidatus Allofournierella merdipullorum]|uniref:hypothetical protein n=1 Tax=Candidatus Allofournierella merdipullorum TaxID=2838595 RepID=UPI00374F82B0